MGVDQLASEELAFTAFYRREFDAQVRRACVLLRSDAIANDVVHDAMLEVFARWDRIREPGAYLNRAVLNHCRDLARRAETGRRAQARSTVELVSPGPEPPLGALFDRLPFNQRAALVLRYYADLSIAEIAAALDCPQGSVGPWIDRALTALREQLR